MHLRRLIAACSCVEVEIYHFCLGQLVSEWKLRDCFDVDKDQVATLPRSLACRSLQNKPGTALGTDLLSGILDK